MGAAEYFEKLDTALSGRENNHGHDVVYQGMKMGWPKDEHWDDSNNHGAHLTWPEREIKFRSKEKYLDEAGKPEYVHVLIPVRFPRPEREPEPFRDAAMFSRDARWALEREVLDASFRAARAQEAEQHASDG